MEDFLGFEDNRGCDESVDFLYEQQEGEEVAA